MKRIGLALISILSVLTIGMIGPASLSHAQNPIWIEKRSMPAVRWGNSSCELNGKVYILGGMNSFSGMVNTVWMFDPVLDTWTTRASMDTVRGVFSICVYDGKIYAIGGARQIFVPTIPLSSINVYDPEQNSWTQLTDMPVARFSHTASLVDGKIYIIGGSNPNWQPIGRVDIYDLATDTWTTGTSMPTPRGSLCAVVLDGIIYTIGGHRGSLTNESGEKTVEVYDPATDTWTSAADMVTKLKMMSASTLNGRIYVFGGAEGYCTPALSGIQEYKPETDSWTKIGDMPIELAWQSSTVVNNKVYVSGGLEGDCSTYDVRSTMYEFVPYHEMLSLIEECKVNSHYMKAGTDTLRIITELIDTSGITLLAEIEAPDHTILDSLPLFDDGMHQDGIAGDNIHSNVWPVRFPEERTYSLNILVTVMDLDTVVYCLDYMARFTTIGPVTLDNLTYMSSDTLFYPGEEKSIKVSLKNIGSTATATNVKAAISCPDTMVTITSLGLRYTNIGAGESKELAGVYKIKIPEAYESGSRIIFGIDISSNDYNFWSDTFSIEIADPTEIVNIIGDKKIRIHPNPTNSILIVESGVSDLYSIEITSLNGQLIYSNKMEGTTHQLDLSSFRKGVYLITIRNKDFVTTRKIIKL